MADAFNDVISNTPEFIKDVPADLATKLMSDASARIGKLILRHNYIKPEKDSEKSPVYELLSSGIPIDKVSTLELASISNGTITARQAKNALSNNSVRFIAQQIVCANLIGATHEKFERLRESLKISFCIAIGVSPDSEPAIAMSNGIFAAITRSTKEYLDANQLTDEEITTSEFAARVALIQARVDSIEANLNSIQKFGNSGKREELEEWIKSYRSQCERAHRTITPPDFRERNPVPLDKIYVPGEIKEQNLTPQSTSISLYDFMPDIDRDVLLGDPGGGEINGNAGNSVHIITKHQGYSSLRCYPSRLRPSQSRYVNCGIYRTPT